MRHSDLQFDSRPTIFFPPRAATSQRNYFALRTSGEPKDQVASVRSELRRLDPAATMAKVRTVSDLVGAALAPNRLALLLLTCFGGIAILLAATGLYGVTAFQIGARLREIGIRMALGATRSGIFRLVLLQSLKWLLLGLLAGILLTSLLTPFLKHLLYGISPSDVSTFALVSMFLLLVGLAGTLLPTRQALKVHPRSALQID